MTGVDTVIIGGSGLITSGTVNVNGPGGNDAISVLGDTTVIDAATITINGGDGDDTITSQVTTQTLLLQRIQRLLLMVELVQISHLWETGWYRFANLTYTISISNIEVIQLNSNLHTINATFQAADISGQSITMKADGAGDGFTVVGAAGTTTIDLSTSVIDQTLTKPLLALPITGSNATGAQTTRVRLLRIRLRVVLALTLLRLALVSTQLPVMPAMILSI